MCAHISVIFPRIARVAPINYGPTVGSIRAN
ncbi:hypothetical protein F383_36255 [Gossypium arboreum]|uniref:Uncharacterized protein n=1 Tax=Gossypium arboreum TaxID=29729 RepID=A0A0B0ND12_GOSAR|nr:hypothetical protein F383_36255 [Gossypium arboreum]